MIDVVNQKVDVLALSRIGRGIVAPIRMKWKNKVYNIKQIGLVHTVSEGRAIHHIFEGTDGTTFFRLRHDSETLQWTLEKISDDLPS